MSEPMDRREVFEPEKVATYTHSVFGGYAPFVSLEDYQRLLAANREKDAEIKILRQNVHEYKALLAVAEEQLASLRTSAGEKEYENDRLKGCIDNLERQLASLRASGGDKPENAWDRGWAAGYQYALDQVNCRTTFASTKYVALPTLTREKE